MYECESTPVAWSNQTGRTVSSSTLTCRTRVVCFLPFSGNITDLPNIVFKTGPEGEKTAKSSKGRASVFKRLEPNSAGWSRR